MSLEFDIRRSIILSEYVKCWGVPESRTLSTVENVPVELYVFSGEDMDQVTRFATIGLSAASKSTVNKCQSELLLVVPFDVGIDQLEVINAYVFDIVAHILNKLDCEIQSEDVLAPSSFAPQNWPSAVLFDEPRGEPEEVSHFHIGMQSVALKWLVPIFSSEYELINNQNIDAFDAAIENSGASLVEIRREPAC